DFVAEGLSGNGDITVHFESRAAFATQGGIHQEIGRLRATPTFAMQPDIDDQTSGAKQLGTEPAEVLRWFLVKSELGTEAFGVESPAFDEGVVVGETLKTRQIFALLLQRDLKVMARNRFVKIERLGSGARIGLDTRGVDVKDSRTRTIGRSGPILRGGRSLSEFFDRADFK